MDHTQSGTHKEWNTRGVERTDRKWNSQELAYVRRNVTEMRTKGIARWHETEIQDREASCHSYYIPWKKEVISLILGSAPKKYASPYYQVKVGHGAVGTFLARIGLPKPPNAGGAELQSKQWSIRMPDVESGGNREGN